VQRIGVFPPLRKQTISQKIRRYFFHRSTHSTRDVCYFVSVMLCTCSNPLRPIEPAAQPPKAKREVQRIGVFPPLHEQTISHIQVCICLSLCVFNTECCAPARPSGPKIACGTAPESETRSTTHRPVPSASKIKLYRYRKRYLSITPRIQHVMLRTCSHTPAPKNSLLHSPHIDATISISI